MTGLKIEGDLSQISDRQLEYIQKVIEQRGFRDNKVIIKPVGKAGDNYVANVKRITVEDPKGGLNIVAKLAPANELQRQIGKTESLFRNEHIMYTKVLPKFTQLEIAADIPPQERLRYAACYGSFEEGPNEVILLEDLNASNFVMLDRLKPIGADCVKSVLKNFALLHSLSYALKFKEPEIYDEFKNSLFDAWAEIDEIEGFTSYFKQLEESASAILDSDIHKNAVLGAVTGSLKDIGKLARNDKHAKHSIILQGDSWTNNIMFKFDGETLLESIMIDYQISKSASPVTDLLYMIFNCTDYAMRKEHFYDWIDYYHTELDKALSNYGLKANFVYPKDQLDVDLKRYGKTSFGQSILLAGTFSISTEEAVTMKEAMESSDMDELVKTADLSSKDPETVSLFKNRIEGLVKSYHEFGLIKIKTSNAN